MRDSRQSTDAVQTPDEHSVLTDAQWAKMEPLCPGKVGDPGRSGADNRLFMEAILWIVRTGRPWRALPVSFGKWNSVYVRFNGWVRADAFKRVFDAVADEPDMEYALIGVLIVNLHRPRQGRRRGLRARP